MSLTGFISRIVVCSGLLIAPQAVAQEPDIEIVVDRHNDSVELFVAARADTLLSAFDLSPQRLTETDGTVEFSKLREGTWDTGDDLFAKSDFALDGAPLVFESMSMMVHPIDLRLPMTTPLEALISVGVCSVDAPDQRPSLDQLHGYSGYIAYTDNGSGALRIDLPSTGRESLVVTVRDFDRGLFLAEYRHVLGDGESLLIPAAPTPMRTYLLILLALGVLATAGVALATLRSNRFTAAREPLTS